MPQIFSNILTLSSDSALEVKNAVFEVKTAELISH